MVFKKIPPKKQAMVQILKEEGKLSVKEISQKSGVSRANRIQKCEAKKRKGNIRIGLVVLEH